MPARLERGLQAAEACALPWVGEFSDYGSDPANGERWHAFGWFGAVAADGRFCGLNRLCENVAAAVTRRRQVIRKAPESASSRRRLPRAIGVFTPSVKAALLPF